MAIQHGVPITLTITEAPVGGDFFPKIDPLAQSAAAGAAAVYLLTFETAEGYANPIALSITGLPEGATATFEPNPTFAEDGATLTIETGAALPGTYEMNVQMDEVAA